MFSSLVITANHLSVERPGFQIGLVPPASLKLALLDPQVARELGVVAADLLDEALGVLSADVDLERVAERERRRERVVDHGVDEHGRTMTAPSRRVQTARRDRRTALVTLPPGSETLPARSRWHARVCGNVSRRIARLRAPPLNHRCHWDASWRCRARRAEGSDSDAGQAQLPSLPRSRRATS